MPKLTFSDLSNSEEPTSDEPTSTLLVTGGGSNSPNSPSKSIRTDENAAPGVGRAAGGNPLRAMKRNLAEMEVVIQEIKKTFKLKRALPPGRRKEIEDLIEQLARHDDMIEDQSRMIQQQKEDLQALNDAMERLREGR